MLSRPPGPLPSAPPAPVMPLPHRPWRALVRPVSVTAAVLLAHGGALWALHSSWHPPAPTPVELGRVEVELRAQSLGVAAAVPAQPPAASDPTVPTPRAAPERPPRPEPQRSDPPPRPPAFMPTPVQPALASPSPASDRMPQADPAAPSPQGAAAAEATPQTPHNAAPHNAAPSHAPPSSAARAQGSSSGPASGTAEAPAGRAAPAPAQALIVPPSSSAAHLHNPAPPYPVLSRRLGEQGRVLLRVRIEADGSASAAQVYGSSGFVRLDQAAQQAVLRWRFVPGTRNGEAQAMWFLVPIQFVLE